MTETGWHKICVRLYSYFKARCIRDMMQILTPAQNGVSNHFIHTSISHNAYVSLMTFLIYKEELMGTYWTMDGTIKPMKNAKALESIKRICDSYNVACDATFNDTDFDLSFYDDGGYDLFNDFVKEISPYVETGEMTAYDADNEAYTRYIFNNGNYTTYYGESLIYYPGLEADFIDCLPQTVVDMMKTKFAKEAEEKEKN